MMALTCFRGPWAYECMARSELVEPETFFDLGERAVVIMVRADERRRATRRQGGEP